MRWLARLPFQENPDKRPLEASKLHLAARKLGFAALPQPSKMTIVINFSVNTVYSHIRVP
jgi:hypothetical protein